MQVRVQYKVTPTAEFVSAMNKFIRDNPPAPSLSATVIWERVILDDQPDDQSGSLKIWTSKVTDSVDQKGRNRELYFHRELLCAPSRLPPIHSCPNTSASEPLSTLSLWTVCNRVAS